MMQWNTDLVKLLKVWIMNFPLEKWVSSPESDFHLRCTEFGLMCSSLSRVGKGTGGGVSLRSCPGQRFPLPPLERHKLFFIQEHRGPAGAAPPHQRVVRTTLHEFLMKRDVPDEPRFLEACDFEVLLYHTLCHFFCFVFFTVMLKLNSVFCAESPAEIRSRMFPPTPAHICDHQLSSWVCVVWESEIDARIQAMCLPVSRGTFSCTPHALIYWLYLGRGAARGVAV